MSKIKIFALGGLNENGKNLYVVEVDESIFVLDAGIKYADDKMLGIDYVLPSYDYLKENQSRIKGIFISHGHDAQMGALCSIMTDLTDVKVYGTEFTNEIIINDLNEDGISTKNLAIIKPGEKMTFGNVSIVAVSLTHSVPGNVGYIINTEDGAIVYTGNFLFDQTMLGCYKTDMGALTNIGEKGVICLLNESLYADKAGYTSPNNRISSQLVEILNKYDDRILFNMFQAQIYRIQELFNAVLTTDRNIVILGKKLQDIVLKAIELKYIIFDKNRILSLKNINDQGVVVIISDEREKPFSNLNRIIKGYDKFVKLETTDTIVVASPVYDGMEKTAVKIFDAISKLDSNLIILSNKKYLGHHASSEDLMMMINLLQPKYYFPVTGEFRHQIANAKLAYNMGYDKQHVLVKLNGEVATFEKGILVKSESKIKVDDILVDGKSSGDIGELVLKDRELLSENGIVIVSASIDRSTKEVIAGPEILTRGFVYVKDNLDLIKQASEISLEVILENKNSNYIDFNKVKMGVRDKLGRFFYKETGCRPMILVVLQEV